MQRIKSFGVYQTAKVVGVIYFIVSAIFMIPMGLFASVFNSFLDMPGMSSWGGVFFFIAPFFYGIVGFIGAAIACFIYNLISGRIGGIEVEFESMDSMVDYVK